MKNMLIALMLLTSSVAFSAEGYKVGDIASDFSLKNVDGTMISLNSYSAAKGVIVIFTCNHCPFSKAYEDRIIALHHEFAAKGYPVLAINPNDPISVPEDSYENMIIRSKEKSFPFHYVVDEQQSIAKLYGATRTPHVYVLQKQQNNQYAVAYIGAIDDNHSDPATVKEPYLAKAINALLNNTKPIPEFTKAIGCSIKWKK